MVAPTHRKFWILQNGLVTGFTLCYTRCMSKTHVVLSSKNAELLRRLQADTGADTLTEVLGDALAVFGALRALTSAKDGRVLAMVDRASGAYSELAIPSLTRAAVWEVSSVVPKASFPPKPTAFTVTAGNQEQELPPDLFAQEVSAAYERQAEMIARPASHPPMALPVGYERMAAARAAQERAHSTVGLSPPKKMLGPGDRPGKTMMSVAEVAEQQGSTEAKVMAALRDGKFDGAELVDGEWWIPYGESKVRR
jgi:hypothetical protein